MYGLASNDTPNLSLCRGRWSLRLPCIEENLPDTLLQRNYPLDGPTGDCVTTKLSGWCVILCT
jgi:hypothetical protein